MCIKRRVRYVTLVEIMIVMAIVISFSGIFGISIYKAKRGQQFQSEVELIVDKLRLAQDLMLILRGDVILKLTKIDADKAALQLEFEVKLPPPWNEELTKASHPLGTIKGFHFEDKNPLERDSSNDEIKIYFLSNGAFMSQGLIRLTDTQREDQATYTRYIYLLGYPAAISSSAQPPKPDALDNELKEDRQFSQRMKEDISAQAS